MKIVILIIALVLVYGCTQENTQYQNQEQFENKDNEIEEPIEIFKEENKKENKKCSEPIIFNSPPVNLEQIEWIVPLGLMSGNHVTPVDHQYYQASHDKQIEVIAPGDGVVTTIERMGQFEEQLEDWRLIIRHSCSIESIYIHIDKLSDKINEQVSKTRRNARVEIPIEAGEVIGWYDHNVDYNVVDQDITIGLLNPESFSVAEEWKIHVQDPFLYFNEDIQKKMIALSLRNEEPFGGKIDYDIEDKRDSSRPKT